MPTQVPYFTDDSLTAIDARETASPSETGTGAGGAHTSEEALAEAADYATARRRQKPLRQFRAKVRANSTDEVSAGTERGNSRNGRRTTKTIRIQDQSPGRAPDNRAREETASALQAAKSPQSSAAGPARGSFAPPLRNRATNGAIAEGRIHYFHSGGELLRRTQGWDDSRNGPLGLARPATGVTTRGLTKERVQARAVGVAGDAIGGAPSGRHADTPPGSSPEGRGTHQDRREAQKGQLSIDGDLVSQCNWIIGDRVVGRSDPDVWPLGAARATNLRVFVIPLLKQPIRTTIGRRRGLPPPPPAAGSLSVSL